MRLDLLEDLEKNKERNSIFNCFNTHVNQTRRSINSMQTSSKFVNILIVLYFFFWLVNHIFFVLILVFFQILLRLQLKKSQNTFTFYCDCPTYIVIQLTFQYYFICFVGSLWKTTILSVIRIPVLLLAIFYWQQFFGLIIYQSLKIFVSSFALFTHLSLFSNLNRVMSHILSDLLAFFCL